MTRREQGKQLVGREIDYRYSFTIHFAAFGRAAGTAADRRSRGLGVARARDEGLAAVGKDLHVDRRRAELYSRAHLQRGAVDDTDRIVVTIRDHDGPAIG